MEKKKLTKILAVVGTVLVWLPILAPLFFSVVALITRGVFRFDYIIPAELFPVVLVGGGLLLWAALWARSRLKLIGWSLGAVAVLLAASQGLAVLTGLASGETEPAGWWFGVVVALLVLYILAVIALAVGGVLLLRDLFKPAQLQTESH